MTSVYFFDAENNGFGSCWLIKKSKSKISQNFNPFNFVLAITNDCGMTSGNWDAIHLVTTNIENKFDANNKAKYRLVSAVFLKMNTSNDS